MATLQSTLHCGRTNKCTSSPKFHSSSHADTMLHCKVTRHSWTNKCLVQSPLFFNPSLNAEAIMSNAPNKRLYLLAIAALHLTPHVLQWPNDPPGQGGRDACRQQWADQRPLELLREVPSAWIHRYEESRHQAHGSDPSYAKTLRTGIVTVRIWITGQEANTLRVSHFWWSLCTM